jgi:DNA-binding NarL/FixJ family response regulator
MAPLCEKSRPHLLIADDHAVFLETLKSFLEKIYVVIGTVTDGRTLVTDALRLKPDMLIVDVNMPLLNGLDASRRIREQAAERSDHIPDDEGRPQLGGRGARTGPDGFRP